MASDSQIIVCCFFGIFFAVVLGYYVWRNWEEHRRRQQRSWDRSRSEDAAERFHSGRLDAIPDPASPEQEQDHRIPFLVVLPDQTLDVALLDEFAEAGLSRAQVSESSHTPLAMHHGPRWLNILRSPPVREASGTLSHQQPTHSLSQRLGEHGIAPLPPARCQDFTGLPETLVWSIALLDHHPFCRPAARSMSSKLASLFRLGETRSLDSSGHRGPSAAMSRSVTRWWSARSQELAHAAPAVARERQNVYQPSDHQASTATARSNVPDQGQRNSSSFSSLGWRQEDASASIHRVGTPELPPASFDGGPSLGRSVSGLRLSGRLGSLGSISSRAVPHSHRHSHQRLNEVLVT